MDPDGDTRALIAPASASSAMTPAAPDAAALLLCTAVPLHLDVRPQGTRAEGAGETDDGSDGRPAFALRRFQALVLVVGALVGGFIQLSSLGANYLLTELYGSAAAAADTDGADGLAEEDPQRTAYVVGFSLLWSLLTSLMGVLVLLLLRSLVGMAAAGGGDRRDDSPECDGGSTGIPSPATLGLHLEAWFAVGTLAGVCLGWTTTDAWLGLTHGNHGWLSLATLAAALLWCRLVTGCGRGAAGQSRRRRSPGAAWWGSGDEGALHEPLLAAAQDGDFDSDEDSVEEDGDDEDDDVFLDLGLVKYESVVLGVLIGIFIQFGSLGANFLLTDAGSLAPSSGSTATTTSLLALLGALRGGAVSEDQRAVLLFSLLWSAATSGMGIAVLLALRGLVRMVFPRSSGGSGWSNLLLLQDAVVQLECGFAVGALVGVNLSWVLTDVMLGLPVQYLHSVLTFGLAGLWCRSLSRYLIRSSEEPWQTLDTDDEEEEDLRKFSIDA